MDVSVIDELPPGRKPITTIHQFDNRRESLYRSVHKQIAEGRQVYIVYPLIKESEKIDLKNLEEGYLQICEEFPDCKVCKVHGKMKPAEELVYNVETTVNPYSSMNQIYGSSDRDEAMILETLILMNRERDALQQAKVVSKNLSQEDWFSTQSTAFALMAMGRLAEKLSGTLDFVWSWNDKQQPAVKSAKAVFEKEIATTPKSGTVSVKNQGKGALSVDLITRTQLLNDTLPAISDNLRMDIRYANLNGTPLSVNDIIQGTDFMAITSISNISGTSDYTNLALTHIIPSGWEIYNERMVAPKTENVAADGSGQSVSKYSYQDIRDDRVLTYFNLRRGETKVFTVRLQATYAGNFILPAVQCEAMYDVNVQARSKAGRTTVSR